MKRDALFLGDKHLPYEQGDIAQQIIDIVRKVKPYYILQVGDLYDFYWFSRYPKHLVDFGPAVEVQRGREAAEKFWKDIQRASPRSKCFQMKGNHCDRPQRQLLVKAPEFEIFMRDKFKSLFEFKGVETIHDSKQELELNICGEKVLTHHGHRSGLGDHMVYNQQSTVNGHSHMGGVVFKNYKDQVRFELNCGYSGNPEELALRYGEQRRKYWTWGLGQIDARGPRFIPLRIR
jgi:hypothetical protein